MAKDSQIDNKQDRKKKSKGNNNTMATENRQNNPNAKKQSIQNNDV
ncbi:MAG: hypothetical protein BWY15_00154 [Firmicutes bacterium ADurb.Bin193]|nr:MAG: hypothetical protein BWY15_00154 [Firmicutes bacterium ADurb.Bin193]